MSVAFIPHPKFETEIELKCSPCFEAQVAPPPLGSFPLLFTGLKLHPPPPGIETEALLDVTACKQTIKTHCSLIQITGSIRKIK